MSERLILSPLGDYYDDLLVFDAGILKRSRERHAKDLILGALNKREALVTSRIKYLADRRDIPFREMCEILRGYEQSR